MNNKTLGKCVYCGKSLFSESVHTCTPQAKQERVAETGGKVHEAVAHDEDWLDRMYLEFDAARAKSGEERLRFKGFMRAYGTRCAAPQQRKSLTDEQARAITYVGPVYAPDGVVTRTAQSYLQEIQSHRLDAIRRTEAAHGIKGVA